MANKKPDTTTRKRVASRTSAPRRGKKKKGKEKKREMPAWLRTMIAVCVFVVFSTGFYWFFIRPYSYRWKPCEGHEGYGVCIPRNYDVHGIDISHHQGSVDWKELASNKISPFPLHFVFMKATEGGDFGDYTFPFNFEQARQYGFIRGAYHFFTPKTDPSKQADFFINTVQLTTGDLPPVLDVETIGDSNPKDLRAAVKIWLSRVEAHYGVKPILYTSYKFKNRYLNDSTLNTYPYWIAHYYVDSVRYKGPWHFWQHTDVGTVSGIKKKVDLNVFNGTLEQLQALTLD